jgi:hypothetical protein
MKPRFGMHTDRKMFSVGHSSLRRNDQELQMKMRFFEKHKSPTKKLIQELIKS